MACSPAQLKSNRENAKHSTGPRTDRGKARSRANALKHGLAAEGHCLPIEDPAVLQTRFDAMADALRPQDEPERVMVQRAALLALRLERCATAEAANLTKAVRDAVSDHDERIMVEVRAIADQFPVDPAGAVRRLKRTAQGVDFLVDHWQGLRDALDRFGFLNEVERERAGQLEGRRFDASGLSRIGRQIEASSGRFVGKEEPLGLDFPNLEARKAAARAELDELLGQEIDRLEAHRLTLRHADADRDRLEAPRRAVVDLSPRGQLLRRYENASAREFHKILAYFDAKDAAGSDAKPDMESNSVELASFGNPPEVVPPVPENEPAPPVVASPPPAVEIAQTPASITVTTSTPTPMYFARFTEWPRRR